MYRTTRKALIGFVLFAVGIPVFYYSLSYATKPTLHDGDRLEVRSCRQCGGTGEDGDPGGVFPDGGGACPFCRGAGEVDVIVPGPNRPTRIWGATIAGDRIGVFDLYAIAPRVRRLSLQDAFMPEGGGGIPGAIAAAEILLRPGENDPIEVTTDAGGRFIADLAPGFYLVEVRAPGFDRLEGELIIPPLTEPIWLEKAKLIDPEESPESIRSRSGSVLIAGLARKGGDGGFLRMLSHR